MFKLSQARTKTLLAIHGGSAVGLGLLLYAVIVTGVASVFSDEIGDWSSPLPQAVGDPFVPGTDALVRTLAGDIDPRYADELTLFPSAGGRLAAFFHTHEEDADGHPEEVGVLAHFDPLRRQRLALREGSVATLFEGDRDNALAQFMVDLHVRLHLPHPWGLLLTGVLGLAMLVAAVTGFVLHRHLIRELFTLRRRGDALLTARDAHVIAGTWNLPFAFLLAFTGSYFSFGSAFGIPAMAMIAFEGDQERLIETVIGEPPGDDPRPAAMADLDAMIADARERSGAAPAFVQVAHWGRADAQVTIFADYRPGALTGPTYLYRGATGDFLRTKPVLGQAPSMGSTLFELMTPLHFGNFAGVFSKVLWFALGFAGAYVSFTGLRLWTQRRQDQPGWAPLARATLWVGYGLPLALVAAAWGYFPARQVGGAVETAMFTAFFVAAALAAWPAWRHSAPRARRTLLALNGVALLGLPVLRHLSGGPGWELAMTGGLLDLLALDIALTLGGLLCLWAARRRPPPPTAVVADAQAGVAHEH